MKYKILPALLVWLVAGCAGPPAPDPNETFVTAIGTPAFLILKVPTCVGSVLIAAPTAAITGLAPTAQARDIRRDIDDGLRYNCGPPYVLQP